MKKINQLYAFCFIALSVTSMTACNKKLDEYNPANATPEEAWTTPEGFSDSRQCRLF